MRIEEALHQSYCEEREGEQPCAGVIVITAIGTTLACKRCGTEKIPHYTKEENSERIHKRRSEFYRLVLEKLRESLL